MYSLQSLIHEKQFLKKKNSSREKIFVHSFESKREKETQSSLQSTDIVYFFSVLQIILSWEADIYESQSTIDCVRNEIYFKEIVSNTILYLNYSSFTHLVYGFFNYLQISYIYTIFIHCFCLSHQFMLLLVFKSIFMFFLLYHKSKLLKYIQQS